MQSTNSNSKRINLLYHYSIVVVLLITLSCYVIKVEGKYPTITTSLPSRGAGATLPLKRLLGQEDYYSSTNGPVSSSSLSNPRVTIPNQFTIFVLDEYDNRVMAFDASATNSSSGLAVLLQDSFTSNKITQYNSVLGGMALYQAAGGVLGENRLFVSNNVSINLFTNSLPGATATPTSTFPNATNPYKISQLGALAVDSTSASNPRLYAADVSLDNPESSRILIFGIAGNLLGVLGQGNLTSKSCGASDSFTCIPRPLAMTVDCNGNLWTCADYSSVSGSSSLLSFWPKNAVSPSISWDGSSQNPSVNCGSLSFNPTCTYLAIGGGAVNIFPVSFTNATSPSINTPAYRFGGGFNGAGPTTDDISFAVDVAWDPANNGGIWVTEGVNNRVVYFTFTTSGSTLLPSRTSNSSRATASTNSNTTLASNSTGVSRSSTPAMSLSPSSSLVSSSASPSIGAPASNSPVTNSMNSEDSSIDNTGSSSQGEATITSTPGSSATIYSWLHLLF